MGKRMVSFVAPFCFLILLSGCEVPVTEDPNVGYEAAIPLITPPETAPAEPVKAGTWTILFYMDADNNLESYLMSDLLEMASGLQDENLNVIVLIDRIGGYSDSKGILYSNFTDARLFRIIPGAAIPLSGGTQFPGITVSGGAELNMGDAATLNAFIGYGKENYPATHYALLFSNHGGGARSAFDLVDERSVKAVCWDDTSGGDALYTAEISDTLDAGDSVDLIIYDACFMGMAEVAYQYRCNSDGAFAADRFNALYMVASAPTVWGYGLPYDRIFNRIKTGGGSSSYVAQVTGGGAEPDYDPSMMTPAELGALVVEEQYDDTVESSSGTDQTLALYDLSGMNTLETAMDALATALAPYETGYKNAIFGTVHSSPEALAYFDASVASDWLSYPFFDLYDVATKVQSGVPDCADEAAAVAAAVDVVVVCSFTHGDYLPSTLAAYNGKYGLAVFSPNGDRVESFYLNGELNTSISWVYQWWYNSIDTHSVLGSNFLYGKLAWCIDGATPDDAMVDNWFELLDYWYDDPSVFSGTSYNGYSY